MAPDANLELYAVRNNIGIDEAISHIISRGEADVITISLGVQDWAEMEVQNIITELCGTSSR